MRKIFLAGVLALSSVAQAQSGAPPAAQPAAQPVPFVRAEAAAAVTDLAVKLESQFVFPDIGKQYATMLRHNLAIGRYDQFADADGFAQTVTEDIQAVHKDGHLHLLVLRPDQAGKRAMKPPTARSGLVKSGWIADGVAYLAFGGFPGNEASLADLRNFIASHGRAKSMIIDIRNHRGGGMDEINLLFPQLFAEETALLDMDARETVAAQRPAPGPEDFVRLIDGPTGVVRRQHYVVPAADPAFRDTKVYLLVGKDTVSAAEHLAMALKRTHRAILIGEATRGAGNFGMFEEIAHGFEAFIPFGRTFDPDTGEGWEGVGVQPDIKVPADKALDEALKRAGVQAAGEEALATLK